jgi:YtkA-like protein
MRKGSVLLCLVLLSCGRQPTELKQIQQQRSGDYTVTLLNDTGALKQHADHLRLEIRNTSTNALADVNNLKVQATMIMAGMGPMFGTLSTPKQAAPGQFDFDAEFGMAGQWNFIITFDPNGRAQFALRAQ